MNINGWAPAPYNVIRDEQMADAVTQEGITQQKLISDEQLNALQKLFDENHNISENGMFYSLYSTDLEYRSKMHFGVLEALKPTLDQVFQDYKVIYSLFIVKAYGEDQTEFFVHQDPSYVDELKYSPMHIWVPLDDITADNGALCVVPRSQHITHPYRNISFPPAFDGHNDKLRRYLKPIYMEKGEALIFDPRLIHNSLANKTNKLRVAALVGVAPKEAELVSSFKDLENDPNAQLEFFKHEDDHFLKGREFYFSCRCRPTEGTPAGGSSYDVTPFTWPEMQHMFNELGIEPVDMMPDPTDKECRMFGEPITGTESVETRSA